MADMKPIYQANNEQQGYERLLEFEEKWGKKYPLNCKSWLDTARSVIAKSHGAEVEPIFSQKG